MKQQKKKIINLTISLFIVCCSSYLIWNSLNTKDKQENIQHQAVHQNSLNIENSAKKKENNDDQQLVSYFSVFVVFWIILAISYFIIRPDKMSFNNKMPDPYLYLMFIKMVCEIVCYENCMVHKTKSNSNKYKPHLQLSLPNLKKFLNKFLFGSQTSKAEVRQQAHQIVSYYQKHYLWEFLIFFLYFFLDYLFTTIINFVINIFSHGFSKTYSRLKISSLWTFIPKMDELYKKIITYLLLSLPLLFFIGDCFYRIFFVEKNQKYDNDSVACYWLLNKFYKEFKNDIVYLFSIKKYKDINLFFLNEIELTGNNNKIVLHHNLDSTKAENFNEDISKYKESFCQGGKILFQDMENYFDKNDIFEKEIFEKLQKFMDNDQIKA